MSTSAIRQALRRSASLRRCNSTAPQNPSGSNIKPKPTHASLPPQKMRALVSLYHQSESFITLENLDEAIDKAFIRNVALQTGNIREQSFYELKSILASKKALPKIGSGRDVSRSTGYDTVNTTWSDPKVKRDIEVQGALYGVEGLGKPGYEVLEEEHERIQGHLRDDRKS